MRLVGWLPWWFWLLAVAALGLAIRYRDYASGIGLGFAGLLVVATVWRIVRRFRSPRIRDWQDAERAAARWLRKAGCRGVSLTGGSADGGIDVITTDWAVQVKHTAKRVGRPAVQQTVGAALSLDRRPALFSTSGFTAPAFDYAEEHEVALFELDLGGSARGVNRAARGVGSRFPRLSLGR